MSEILFFVLKSLVYNNVLSLGLLLLKSNWRVGKMVNDCLRLDN